MNRCIQCTRCVRFTQEISKTGELGFFERGSHAEIGTFPGRPLDNPLSTNVVDICPVGALTSTRFRFAERVWYLDKKPSICTGCDVGCNVTMEHRRGAIKRLKPRLNAEVNDYWMCDFGRGTHERFHEIPRLLTPRLSKDGEAKASGWRECLDVVFHALRSKRGEGAVAFLGSGFLSTEEAFLLARIADTVESPHRSVWVDSGPSRAIPNLRGGIVGHDAAPNRRGAELAGLVPGEGGLDAEKLLLEGGAKSCAVLVVADSDFGKAAYDPKVVERLREARFLVVLGWADSPLARVADVALPTSTHAETAGTFVNVERRLQRFDRAFPAPSQTRPGVEVLADLLSRFDPKWGSLTIPTAFDLMAEEIDELAGLRWAALPPTGVALADGARMEAPV